MESWVRQVRSELRICKREDEKRMAYILKAKRCDSCVWGENGFYNAHCAHCPECFYGKNTESSYLSQGTAEMLIKAGILEEK